MSGQSAIMQSMNQHFDRLQMEMDKNNELQGQLVQMQQQMDANQQRMQQQMNAKQQEMQELQQQMDAKQQQMYQLQQETNEVLLNKQQEILQMQQQALDRLAVIQSSVLALVTQTYELHEYPIPRLFIVLPKTLGLSGKIKSLIADQFRLYFLCECGTHTMSEDTMTPHQIHLAKHEGYDLEKPTVFFERYGKYVLTLMHMIKYGITAAGIVIPPLASSKIIDGIDTTQKHLDYLKKNIGPLIDDTIKILSDIKNNQEMGEELRADLRQLESYLKVKDKGRVLGNLYRIVTLEGHVKWVCFDHYRAAYRETTIKRLQEIVELNEGAYIKETGSIKINLATHTQAKQFYDAMINARCIQELDITLKWDATMDELRKLAKAVTMANVINLTVNGTFLKSPALDVVNRTRRFDPIMQLASNARLQALHIRDFGDFFARVSKSALSLSLKLRTLTLRSELPAEDKVKSLGNILTLYSALTTLEVKLPPGTTITEAVFDILSKLPKLESLNVNCEMCSIVASVKNGEIQDTVLMSDKINDLVSDDFDAIQGISSTRLLIKDTPQEGHIDRLLDTLITSEISRIQLIYRNGRSRLILAAPERTLQDLDEMLAPTHPIVSSISVDCARLSLTVDCYYTRKPMGLTIARISDLQPDELQFIREGHVRDLVIMQTPRTEDKDRLIDILHCRKLNSLEFKYGVAHDPAIDNESEMKLFDLVTLVTSTSATRLESLLIDYKRISLAARCCFAKTMDMNIERLDRLCPDDLTFNQQGHINRLTIRQIPRIEDRDRLIDTLYQNRALRRLEIGCGKDQEPATLENPEMRLMDLVTVVTSNTDSPVVLSIQYQRLNLIAKVLRGDIQDAVMTITQLKDIHSDDLIFVEHFLTRLEIRDIPQQTKDQLTLIFQLNIPYLHLRIRCQKESPRVERRVLLPVMGTEDGTKLQDVVEMAVSTCKIKSLRIDYQELSIKNGVSQAVTRKADMAITTLGAPYLTRLTTWHDKGLADEIWWIEIVRTSQSLTHLQVGCKGELAPSLVDLVVSTRNDTLQRRGSCSLRTFELMDDPLVPFDVLADRDAKLHIQCHITFPDDSITFDMRTWIRFEEMTSFHDLHPMLGFIHCYGWSIAFLDGYILGDEKFASLLNTIRDAGNRRLESLIVYATTTGDTPRGVNRLDEVIKRSPNLKLGLCLRLGHDIKLIQSLLIRYSTIISKIQLCGGTPEQWSGTSSSFPARHHFPVLESFMVMLLPQFKESRSLVRQSWQSTSWITTMVSAPSPRGSTASIVQLYPQRATSDTDDPSIVHDGTTLAESWIPLRKIVLRHVKLWPKEWRTVVEALDFSVLEHLDLQGSNFSMKHFKLLMERLFKHSDSNIPLQTMDVVGTHLAKETDQRTLEEMMAPLRKKTPSITISTHNLNPLPERQIRHDSEDGEDL
ncbi:hypothetical protein BGX34_007136 [Mortierella sp. NVP85]|nr:hypothetical protein BGX34_007136 [Mortierella sp. NVP85]